MLGAPGAPLAQTVELQIFSLDVSLQKRYFDTLVDVR